MQLTYNMANTCPQGNNYFCSLTIATWIGLVYVKAVFCTPLLVLIKDQSNLTVWHFVCVPQVADTRQSFVERMPMEASIPTPEALQFIAEERVKVLFQLDHHAYH